MATKIEKIVIPDTVTSIGERCFELSSLKEVVLPDNLEVISKRAFYRCGDLSIINVPSKLTQIDEYAFSFTGIEQHVFQNNENNVIIGQDSFSDVPLY